MSLAWLLALSIPGDRLYEREGPLSTGDNSLGGGCMSLILDIGCSDLSSASLLCKAAALRNVGGVCYGGPR